MRDWDKCHRRNSPMLIKGTHISRKISGKTLALTHHENPSKGKLSTQNSRTIESEKD